MVIGKITPPAALCVEDSTRVNPESAIPLIVVGLSTIAATLGQYTPYRGFNDRRSEFLGIRRRIPYVDRIPQFIRARIGSLMSVPAGLSRYPARRFLVLSTIAR